MEALAADVSGQFAIDATTGNVTILSGPFDFTSQSSYTIVVEAVDGSLTVQRSFTIQVSPSDLDAAGLAGDQVLNGANGNIDEQLYGGSGNDTHRAKGSSRCRSRKRFVCPDGVRSCSSWISATSLTRSG